MAGFTSQSEYLTNAIAAADYSTTGIYLAVKLTASNTVTTSGTAEASIGILQNAPTSGQAAEVKITGGALAEAGGTVSAGGRLAPDAAGALVAATTGQEYVAIAVVDAVDGDIFHVIVNRGTVA